MPTSAANNRDSEKNSLSLCLLCERYKKTPRLPILSEEPRYTKFQIAMRYFPDDSFATASRKLRRWIHDDPPLNEQLRRMGYHASQKYFSQAHLEVLREYLGEPLE